MKKAPVKKNTDLQYLFSEFLLNMRSEQYSPETVDKYDTILKLFQRSLTDANCRLEHITTYTIRLYFANLTCGRKTALNYHTTLSAFWRWCVLNGYTKENTVRKAVKIRPSAPGEILPFTRDEVSDMLRTAQQSNSPKRDIAVILLLLDTGLRAAEFCNIVLND